MLKLSMKWDWFSREVKGGAGLKEKMKILRESVSTLDWVSLGVLSFFCFICYQHEDIRITGGNSIAYLNGHILDFYDYNSTKIGGTNYLPTTYILFAIWNIPIRVLGLIKEPTMEVGALIRMWYKLGTFLLFLATAYILYKICIEKAVPQKQAIMAAFLFLSNPIAIYSELIFGQYDIITAFFMCLGFYYFLKEDRKKFVLSFAVALTCKYFALLIFVPLLLLKEKNTWKIIRDMLGVASLFIVETLFCITSEVFRTGIFGFQATNHIFQVSLNNGFQKISLVVVFWVLICAFAYFKELKDEEWFAWSIYLSCGVMFLCFGLSLWNPQWLLMAVPFLTLGMVFNRKTDIYLLLDLLMYVIYILFVVNFWPRWCDQNLFDGGIFRRFVHGIVSKNLAMMDIMIFKDKDLLFSAFTAVLLAYVVFLHPKRMCRPESACKKMQKGILRLRYIGGCCIFIIPSLICLAYNLTFPRIIYESDKDITKIVGPMRETDVYEQVFQAKEKTISGITIMFGTYMKENNSIVKCELVDNVTSCVLNELELDTAELQDNQYVRFDFSEISEVEAGKEYVIKIYADNILPEDRFTLYRTEEKTEEDDLSSYALINGRKKNYDLGIQVYGK